MDDLFTLLGNLDREGIAIMKRTRRLLPVALSFAVSAMLASQAWADPLILQGSTTFNRRVMEPLQSEIESKSGQELTVIPNRTMLGIIALLEGRAHMAMTSASLEGEVGKLKKAMPGLDYDRLKMFEVTTTRVAFIVNPANPVRKASLDQVKKVLTGGITNWKDLGGADAPLRVVIVGGGGGVTTTAESEMLDGQAIRGPNVIYTKTALQLVAIVEQEPNAFGIAQLSLARQKGLPEIATEKPVEQVLGLITLGEPNPAMKSVIDAARAAVAKTM